MKLLFFSAAAPEGGHFRSMVTIGNALERRGHQVLLVTGRGPGVRLAEAAGMRTVILPSPCLRTLEFNWRDFTALRNLVAEFRPDVLHSFANGIPALLLVARVARARVVVTLCGGPRRRIMTKVEPVIVFSEELRENMIDLGIDGDQVFVIPGRMDLSPVERDCDVAEYLGRLDLAPTDAPFVFMICRADVPKQRALLNLLAVAEKYGGHGWPGTFVHIGAGKDAEFVSALHVRVEQVNRRAGRRILISTDVGSSAPAKYLHLADLVIGMGRSAFEGMALAKPTVILSNEGYGGVVAEDTIWKLQQHNFTGRGTPCQDRHVVAEVCADEVRQLLTDPRRCREVGGFAKRWLEANLDVRLAVEQYEKVYQIVMSEPPPALRYGDLARNIIYEWLRLSAYATRQQLSTYRTGMRGDA